MEIETVDDFAEKICDWMECYGTCTETVDGDGCVKAERWLFCCRVGAMLRLPDRIRAAVDNERKYSQQ